MAFMALNLTQQKLHMQPNITRGSVVSTVTLTKP